MDDPRKLSAQELVQLCLDSQDEASWTEFVRRFQPTIAGVVTKCVRAHMRQPKPDLIEDLTQETFLKLVANDFKALRTFEFRHERAFFGFLKVVAMRVVEDYYRKLNSDKNNNGREEEDIDTATFPVTTKPRINAADLSILMREIDQCLTEQSSEPNFTRDYTIFWLYYRQGVTADAISSLPGIGLGVKGVESTLLRLIYMLRSRLKPSQK
ncbi:MAG TPA: sigma-70 family RNA polymerase sigma factor [Candidatus Angelobacter sp.]|jgi:RNA polymerase sigma-70 factor (ECF subfamily)